MAKILRSLTGQVQVRSKNNGCATYSAAQMPDFPARTIGKVPVDNIRVWHSVPQVPMSRREADHILHASEIEAVGAVLRHERRDPMLARALQVCGYMN